MKLFIHCSKKNLFYLLIILLTSLSHIAFAEDVTITASENIEVEKDKVFGTLSEASGEGSPNWILFRYPQNQVFKQLLIQQDPDFPAVKKIRLSGGELTNIEISLENHSKLQKIKLPQDLESSWLKIEVLELHSNESSDQAFGFLKFEPEVKEEEFKKPCIPCRFKK